MRFYNFPRTFRNNVLYVFQPVLCTGATPNGTKSRQQILTDSDAELFFWKRETEITPVFILTQASSTSPTGKMSTRRPTFLDGQHYTTPLYIHVVCCPNTGLWASIADPVHMKVTNLGQKSRQSRVVAVLLRCSSPSQVDGRPPVLTATTQSNGNGQTLTTHRIQTP